MSSSSHDGPLPVAMVADDLTGAADSGVQLVRAGYRTAVAFHGAPVPPAEDLDAVAFDTDSRTLSAGAAAERVADVAGPVAGARILYKKLDSTLRGPVAAELSATLEATGRSRAVVAPAFPGIGRTTRGGVQLLHGEPVDETDLADDPRTPVLRSHLPSILEEAGLGPVGTLSVEALADAEAVRRTVEGNRWTVADAETGEHLDALVSAVPDPSEVLWAGSGGLALALGDAYPGPHSGGAGKTLAPARRVLTVVGSVNEVSRGQLRRLADLPGIVPVPLDSGGVCAGDARGAEERAAATARELLGEGRSVVLFSTSGEKVDATLGWHGVDRGAAAGLLAEALAGVVAELAEGESFDALVLTGGDTAVNVARRLGASGILLRGEVEAGVPFGELICPQPYRVVTKAGGFGGPETLVNAFYTLTKPVEGRIR